jgi:ABC-type sugar transport system ATPase subunit
VDVGTKAEIFRMVQELAAQGYGFLFYSSDVAELTNVPHRVVVMYDGQVTAEFGAGTFTQEQLVAAMVGRPTPELQMEEGPIRATDKGSPSWP